MSTVKNLKVPAKVKAVEPITERKEQSEPESVWVAHYNRVGEIDSGYEACEIILVSKSKVKAFSALYDCFNIEMKRENNSESVEFPRSVRDLHSIFGNISVGKLNRNGFSFDTRPEPDSDEENETVVESVFSSSSDKYIVFSLEKVYVD
jgi:hypothetical protein